MTSSPPATRPGFGCPHTTGPADALDRHELDFYEREIVDTVAPRPRGVALAMLRDRTGLTDARTWRVATGLAERKLLASDWGERYPGQVQRYFYPTERTVALAGGTSTATPAAVLGAGVDATEGRRDAQCGARA